MHVALLVMACLAALVATAAPLPVYAATLVLFGFAHVVVELRYVRDRFGGRVDRRLAGAWLALLAWLALVRAADYARLPVPGGRSAHELALLVLLLAVTALATHGRRRWIAMGATGAFAGVLLLVSPAVALVALAFLHNLTPLGFLAEALRDEKVAADPVLRRERRRAFVLALFAFLVVPALIAGGVVEALLGSLHLPAAGGAFLGIGRAADHFAVYVPGPWRESAIAPRLFAAAVYLQCAHYFVVLHVLPHIARTGAVLDAAPPLAERTRAAFGAVRLSVALAVAAGGIVALAFLHDFADGRSLYGIAASMHAWIEWPLFLAVVLGVVR